MIAEFWFIKLFTLFSEKKSWFLIFLLFSKMIFLWKPFCKAVSIYKSFYMALFKKISTYPTDACGSKMISFPNSFNDWSCTCGEESIWTIWIYFQFKFRYKSTVWIVLICTWFYYSMTELFFFLSKQTSNTSNKVCVFDIVHEEDNAEVK